MGLDGVIAQQGNYARSAFSLAYRNIRHQGVGGGAFPAEPGLVPLSTVPFDEVCAYDRPFFPDDRGQFLRSWLRQPRGVAFGLRRAGRLAGYGVMRVCRTGYKIGPLFADRPAFAEALFLALKAQAPVGAPVFLDTPAVNPEAVGLAARHRLTAVFETARMYLGPPPELPVSRLFGVTTFELG